ncbi:pentatricopeptide repeat-containing protein At5g18390, mitochondrial [Mercurialis annua]|uniref:pentatricopeptide repeat-containing protein At5g18390, mitochondrial n=1 Tax=Mercurialis annua TaxID=3986 RepID=UPI00215F2B70|nr:pentatricopeptide repeat-containing protein At5g18390, mitochondrial [Mercurialis annua]XP_050225619.1 pentatricopeptide repeat-containing protein At5g18390, mitochondrial [Mercurialis annua]
MRFPTSEHEMLRRASLFTLSKTTTLQHLRHLKTLTSSTQTNNEKDAYFALIHHITNVVRRDFYPERTLNRLHIQVNSELVYRVLRACSASPSESLRFFNWSRAYYTPTSLEYEELIKTLVKSKRYTSMWKLITQLKTHNPQFTLSGETVCFIIEEYGKHGLIDQAVEVFNRCNGLNCDQTVDVYNSLLFALCEVKLFHGAYALVRRLIRKGLVPNKNTYGVLVNGWCSNGKFSEARVFLEEMSKNGFNPPVRGRDLLIEGLVNAGCFESAKEMVSKMSTEGCVPDVHTFNALIESICNSTGEVDFCVDVYYNLCKCGFAADINTYKILIPAVSKVGKIDVAFRLLNNSIEDGHKPFPGLYAAIIKGMCRKGLFDDAFCFFGEMKVKGHPPNRPVYTMLITMCGRGGKYVEAANYLFEMTEIGLTPISRCFDMVADGLKNCGKHDLAKRIEQLEVSVSGL